MEPTGKELTIASRGGYELVRVPFTADGLAEIDLRPAALADFMATNHDALLSSLGYPVMNPTVRAENGGGKDADRVPEPQRA